jgi:hypothetical protein
VIVIAGFLLGGLWRQALVGPRDRAAARDCGGAGSGLVRGQLVLPAVSKSAASWRPWTCVAGGRGFRVKAPAGLGPRSGRTRHQRRTSMSAPGGGRTAGFATVSG